MHRFKTVKANSFANFERTGNVFTEFDEREQDPDPETEKFPNNSKKRLYKHLKDVISRK